MSYNFEEILEFIRKMNSKHRLPRAIGMSTESLKKIENSQCKELKLDKKSLMLLPLISIPIKVLDDCSVDKKDKIEIIYKTKHQNDINDREVYDLYYGTAKYSWEEIDN